MITIWEGAVGQGKTYMLAKQTLWLLQRNRIWYTKRKLPLRKVYTNMRLSAEIEKEFAHYISYWNSLEQLVAIREGDVIFDDLATYLDAQEWTNVPMTVKQWLRLHEHYGVDIYGNAQDMMTIYIGVRRLVTECKRTFKIIGSDRPSFTKPKITRIWGLFMWRYVAPEEFDKETTQRKMIGRPHFEKLQREVCAMFDTSQDLQPAEWPPLQHIERLCLDCETVKTIHR